MPMSCWPNPSSVEPAGEKCLLVSPLKGRTARRRSRRVVRTGAHAIEKAKERSVDKDRDNLKNREVVVSKKRRAEIDSPAIGSVISSPTRRKHPKPTRQSEPTPQQKCQQSDDVSSTATDASFIMNHELNISGPSENLEWNFGSAEGASVRKSSSSECHQNSVESQVSMSSQLKGCNASTCSLVTLSTGTSRRKELNKTNHFSEKISIEPATPTLTLGAGACGRDATEAQDVGNYRMLIDDLSYLCSAVIQSRARPVQHHEKRVNITHKHTPVTAGAACDIAELVSQSSTRSKLLIVSPEGARVGALGAVLESIACAPQVLDLSATCRDFIYGHNSHLDSDMAIVSAGERKTLRAAKEESISRVWKGALDSSHSQDEIGKYDDISSKALSIIAYFVGIDCTADKAVLSKGQSNCLAVQLVRESVLQHKSALLGVARLVADDPLVHAYLIFSKQTFENGIGCTDDFLTSPVGRSSTSPHKFPSSPCFPGQSLNAQSDPTKLGRRNRKKRLLKHEGPSTNHHESAQQSLDPVPLADRGHCSKLSCPHIEALNLNKRKHNEDHSSLDFSPKEGRGVEHSGVNKYEEKISLAFSRTKLMHMGTRGISNPTCSPPNSTSSPPLACQFCILSAPLMIDTPVLNGDSYGATSASSVALLAADFIVTGRDKLSTEVSVTDRKDGFDSLNLGSNLCNQHLYEPTSTNPITHANEMLRLSGSLPYYSRSMCETLMAILLSFKVKVKLNPHGKVCTACISYLQHRASLLSEVIDSLCCLSPSVSAELSLHKLYLVPSLLRAVAELSFVVEINQLSVCCDSICTALKTLTSLTHENSVACEQFLQSYCWKISLPIYSQDRALGQISGLDIIFSFLFKTASLSLLPSARDKARYDSIIFSLNILTNIVEMVPDLACSMIENIMVRQGSGEPTSGLSWLVQWLVSRTAGFRHSIMRGTFGSSAVSSPAAEVNDLKTGEDDNLVTTGNGFVFLACLMINDGATSSSNIRGRILNELPVDESGNSGGIQFMIRTLKAFCNFYHFSVGDLSVAVIAPVVKLIAGLERMDQEKGMLHAK